jgi:Na+/H+-translocating membrane pyrophosphatase
MQASTTSMPTFIERTVTKFEWRHVKGIAAIRVLVALWLLFLGSILCAYGYWWGAILFVVAGLVGWLAYQMPRWKLALDAERGPSWAAPSS